MMATNDDLRAAGKEIQGQLWPATRTAPDGQFPAAKLARIFSTMCSRPRSE